MNRTFLAIALLSPGLSPLSSALAGQAPGAASDPDVAISHHDRVYAAGFMTNPAGSAIVNAVGPIRQVVTAEAPSERRYLVIVPGMPGNLGQPVQVQGPGQAATAN